MPNTQSDNKHTAASKGGEKGAGLKRYRQQVDQQVDCRQPPFPITLKACQYINKLNSNPTKMTRGIRVTTTPRPVQLPATIKPIYSNPTKMTRGIRITSRRTPTNKVSQKARHSCCLSSPRPQKATRDYSLRKSAATIGRERQFSNDARCTAAADGCARAPDGRSAASEGGDIAPKTLQRPTPAMHRFSPP